MDTAPHRLLIVEDSPVYAEILLQLLPSLGAGLNFVPIWVDSAEKAITELDHNTFELAFLDYKLPGADGLSLLAHIQLMPHARRPAVIMLTGIGREEVAVEAMKIGAKDYLSKDHLDVPSLLRAITGAIERKQTEDALAKERALLRSLMDSAPDYIYFKDTGSRYTHINASHARDLHLTRPEDAIGKTDADFFPPAIAREIAADEQQILQTGQPMIAKEQQITYPSGKTLWLSATKVPFHDRQGNIAGLLGISRDITVRKQLEEELARTAGELAFKNTQMQADLEMAREIQEAFLPLQYPVFPANASPDQSALRFHHRYRPAVAVGGDFFDVLALSDHEAGVLVCDVMGHGVRAALVTAIIRALIEQFKPLAHNPGPFLTAINTGLVAILKQTKMPTFASAFYLVADTGRAQLRYASAGHHAPCRIRRANAAVKPLPCPPAATGPALGVFEHSTYAAAEDTLAAGDTFLLFTDGLFEVRGRDGTYYGQERLVENIARHTRLPVPDLLDELLREVEQFAGSPELNDDLCIVAVETARLQTP
jgi:sigma-B regulation protein RsbU (phosphoserine phosphatase)